MRRKALILTTRPQTTELEELLFALGADHVGSVLQKRPRPDPVSYLGAGKLEEARATQRALGADLVVVNAALKPGQIYALQRFFTEGSARETREERRAREDESERDAARGEPVPVEVYDRTRLILEIFRERAQSQEARLQVELAQLTYDMPLVKEAINREKKGERQAAMFGGGEYGVNEYYDTMKRRMARIRRDLDKTRLERGVRRKHRRRGGFHLVSLAGYTNAGKSSLLRVLSNKETLIENRYFSTLSTKTARAMSDRREILVTDTVGFIEDLPPWLVEAFHSTLEEIALADIILLVLDASDPLDEMTRRLRSSLRILHEFDAEHMGRSRAEAGAQPGARGAGAARAGAGGPSARSAPEGLARPASAPILVALNKTDRASADDIDAKQRALEAEGLLRADRTVRVSAKTRDGLDDLYEKLYSLIPDYDEYEVAVPSSASSESFIAWLHDHADVLDLTRGNEVHLHFEAKRSLRSDLVRRLEAVGASALREVLREVHEPSPGDETALEVSTSTEVPDDGLAGPRGSE